MLVVFQPFLGLVFWAKIGEETWEARLFSSQVLATNYNRGFPMQGLVVGSSNRLIHWLALCPWTEEDRIRYSPSFFIVVRWPHLISGTLNALRRPPLIFHTHTYLTFSLGARSRKYIHLRRRAREWAIAASRVDSNMFIIRPGE